MTQAGEVAKVFLEGTRGAAPEHLSGPMHLLACENSRASTEDDALTNCSVFADADLTPENRAVLNDARTRDARSARR